MILRLFLVQTRSQLYSRNDLSVAPAMPDLACLPLALSGTLSAQGSATLLKALVRRRAPPDR